MTKKIKILGLNKTEEYLDKEVGILHANKIRLLKESDWTQIPDAPLSIANRLSWRIWRHKVRCITINRENLEQSKINLDSLESCKPRSTVHYEPYINCQFNFSTDENFKQSCLEILKEVIPNKASVYKNFLRTTKESDMETTFAHLLETIKSWI